jgi:hypothetical protein
MEFFMCSNHATRHLAWGLTVAVLAHSTIALADDFPDVEQAKVAATVGEMLAIDTRIALKKEQQRELEAMGLKQPSGAVVQAAPQVAPRTTPIDAPEKKAAVPEQPKPPVLSVEGIFGPGDQLFADVLIDGRKVRFKSGQRYPIGYGNSFAYQLVSINVPCIRLAGPAGSQKLCIDGIQEN